jgi:thiol:disulfide interchange protein DsbD
VYYKEALIRVPVERNSSGVLPLTLNITSQGCADAGVCYPPQKQSVSLNCLIRRRHPSRRAGGGRTSGDESGPHRAVAQDASFWLVVVSFFGFGLLLSLTPCVFPMIPILSGIIVGAGRDGHGVSHAADSRCRWPTCWAWRSPTRPPASPPGSDRHAAFGSACRIAWVLGGFALIFVVLSLSMFGFYELQVPTSCRARCRKRRHTSRAARCPG